jgi:hypothetical protein
VPAGCRALAGAVIPLSKLAERLYEAFVSAALETDGSRGSVFDVDDA